MAAVLGAILFIMSYRDLNEDLNEDSNTRTRTKGVRGGQGQTPVTLNFYDCQKEYLTRILYQPFLWNQQADFDDILHAYVAYNLQKQNKLFQDKNKMALSWWLFCLSCHTGTRTRGVGGGAGRWGAGGGLPPPPFLFLNFIFIFSRKFCRRVGWCGGAGVPPSQFFLTFYCYCFYENSVDEGVGHYPSTSQFFLFFLLKVF